MTTLAVLPGCKEATSVAPRETFDWARQSISFAPPAEGWRREGELSGGIRGVRFIKERSVGEAIGIGDYYIVGERSRVDQLQELFDQFETYGRREFPRAVALARSRTDDPLSAHESAVAEAVNGALDRALSAYHNGDPDGARKEVAVAIAEAERLQLSLDDVVDRVEFSPERRQEPQRFEVVERRDLRIGGEPAVVVDYTRTTSERIYYGREAYVVHKNHLFVATFIGLQENLALFDRVLASVEFP